MLISRSNCREKSRMHKESNMAMAKLLRHIDISAYGSELMVPGDLNADGRLELIFMQGPGMLAADIFKPGASGSYGALYTTAEDQALDCLTAIDADGNVLWQQGRPWAMDIPYRQHGGAWMMIAEDIDGDGKSELVRIRGNQLQVLDPASGRTLRSATLDSDGYSSLHTARFSHDGTRHVVVKPCSDGLTGHPYCCPLVAFDSTLRQVWAPRDFPNAGHTPLAFDVDGDGIDEFLVGPHCVNADGSIRWSLPLDKTHDDRRYVMDIDGDGRFEQVLAFEAEGLVVSDLQGHILWRRAADHCGGANIGKFLADVPGLQIFANNENWRVNGKDKVASYLLDCQGKTLWESEYDRYATTIDWPTQHGPQAMLAAPHDPTVTDQRPFVMDGMQQTLARFDIPQTLKKHTDFKLPHNRPCWGDWGDHYSSEVCDLDGSGAKIILWTRKDLWIFDAKPPR
ncbi:MAG: hypothetical protein HY343_07470 [Lentisphaerae bacterium]|nr:hypothetical protein [Lentisphaerota bacterium]